MSVKNAYDIRYEKNLVHIIQEKENLLGVSLCNNLYSETTIILYLYYEDTLSTYYDYIDRIQDEIKLYIISSKEEVLNAVREHMEAKGRKYADYLLKENRGRDVSALLVTAANIIKRYKYICFLHDKKEHCLEMKEDTDFWIENLWGNSIGSANYIDGVLKLFYENETLGVVTPPEPIGNCFNAWYGFGWYGSLDITRKIADRLKLEADIDEKKPPFTIGTVLWFKRDALKKLFAAEWDYSDFNDEQLKNDNYLSYGIERIFPYVAQDAGYDTGTIMTVAYAEKQINYIQYSAQEIISEAKQFFPIFTVNDMKYYKKGADRIREFAGKNKNLYLYGAGTMGKLCSRILRSANFSPMGYIVSEVNNEVMVEGLPVYTIQELKNLGKVAIIITIVDKRAKEEIVKNLRVLGNNNYIMFWDE